MVMREIYSTGLKRKVECEVSDIIATKTKGGGSRYQVIGFHTNPETGKEHKCQSMIGAQEAAQICEQLGKTLPVYAAEEVAPAAFAAEASEPADSSGELLVPEPSTDPVGDGRVIGQHTGGEIVSATDAAPSLPAHDYVWAGRAEDVSEDKLKQIAKEIDAAQRRDAKENSGKKYITAVNKKYGSDAVRKASHYMMTKGAEDPYNNYNKGNDGSGESIYGRGALSRLKQAIATDSPEEVAIPMEAGKADQEALDEAVEDMDAEFDEVIESVNNTFEDSDGREVFVVDTPIKNYLEEVMADDMRDGFVSISKGSNADEWEIAFPYEFAEDVIDAIVEFQEMDDPVAMDFYMNRPEVEEDIYAARGVDSLNEVPEKFSKATIAMITAAIGLAGVWAWSNSKK